MKGRDGGVLRDDSSGKLGGDQGKPLGRHRTQDERNGGKGKENEREHEQRLDGKRH